MSNARNAVALARVDPGPGYGRVFPFTANGSILVAQDGGLIVNDGAPAGLLLDLPEAVPGMEYPFKPAGNYSIVVKPSGINAVSGLAAGERLALPRRRLTVLGCSSAGLWEVLIGDAVRRQTRIDLETFVSAYAEPGESVVFSGDDWATNPPSQTQRRKNWRILMEAALKANGGTGAYDGAGWYTTNETGLRAARGEVFIGGPLVIEAYADGEYAPYFATSDTTQLGATTRGWTLPAVTISGNGGTIGYNTTTGLIGGSASRLIGYGVPAVQFYPGAGPLGSGIGRHLSYWKLKGIGLARIGDTSVASVANPVFRAANFYNGGAIKGVCSYWQIDDVTIDLDPSSGYAQVGALIQCGLDCQVPSIRIMGNGNSGWGMVVSGTFNGTAKVQPTTTVMFGSVLSYGSKRGVVWTYANCFVEILDLEPVGLSASKQQFILGDASDGGAIGMLWAEDCYLPDGATASGADAAVVVIGGIDSEWNPSYGSGGWTYTKPGPFKVGENYLDGHSGAAPTYGIMAKSCADLDLGPITGTTFGTAVLRLQPGTVSVPDDPAYLRGSFDSARAQWGDTPAFLSDGTDYAYNGFAATSGMADRALGGVGRAPAKPNRSSSIGSIAVRGEKVMHTAPVAGGPQGWICTTAGAYATCVYTPFGASYLEGTATYDPANLVAGAAPVSTTVTVTGAALGDKVTASFSLDLQKVRLDAYVSAADTVTVTFQNINTGGADVNLGSGTISCRVHKS